MLLYADDIVLTVADKDAKTARDLLQADVDSLVKWCTSHGLTMNTKKTQAVWYGEKTRVEAARAHKVTIRGVALQTPDEYTYLGVKLDSELKLETHLQATAGTARQRVFKLTKLRRYISELTAILVYKQTILPHFDYCSFIIEGGGRRV